MCQRTCPKCKSTEHYEGFSMVGFYIACKCGAVLAHRRDEAAAPTDMTDEEVQRWVRRGSFVIPGAEAVDLADDEQFKL